MSYQLYRNTTLGKTVQPCYTFSPTPPAAGHTLQESLDELMQHQMLSPALALRVLIQFDKSINTALNTRVKTKLNFKVSTIYFTMDFVDLISLRPINSTLTAFVTTSGPSC